MKKLLGLFASVIVLPLAMAAFAQETTAPAKEARWEGTVIRSSAENATLTVHKVGSTLEKTVHYSSSTRWVSQSHGDTKVNDIDSSQVKDGDYVICTGTFDKNGAIQATLVSKRLSHSK